MLAVIFIVVATFMMIEATFSDNPMLQKDDGIELVPVESCYDLQPDGTPVEIVCGS